MRGVVQVAGAVVAAQSQVTAGRVVDAALPHLPAVLCGAGAEGFLHFLVAVCAVAVAVVAPGRLEVEPLQRLLQAGLPSGQRGGRPGLRHGQRLLTGRCHGCLEREQCC